MATVCVQDVIKTYNLGQTAVEALRGIDIAVDRGEFITVAGPSGSGKSTLLNLIGCLDSPTAGSVWINDTETSGLTERALDRLRRATIGFIFQSFNLIPVLDVRENVELPLLIRPDVSVRERRERVAYFMDEVGLTKQARQKPGELSGGQRQRVAVARALVTRPSLVLADEPTANLDSRTGIEIIALMHEVNRRERTTFIFSTHDAKIIDRSQRVIYLEDGKVAGERRP